MIILDEIKEIIITIVVIVIIIIIISHSLCGLGEETTKATRKYSHGQKKPKKKQVQVQMKRGDLKNG